MANYLAIKTVCEGVINLLRSQYRKDDFGGTPCLFDVYTARTFSSPMKAGVSLFLHRVYANSTHRTPAGRVDSDGGRYNTQLPVDLYFLLTIWAQEASLQHAITGWLMRTLEDHPVLVHSQLNFNNKGVFQPGETVPIMLVEMKNEDLVSIWRDLLQSQYQLSIPYMARNVRIESQQLVTTGAPLREREFDFTPEIPVEQ